VIGRISEIATAIAAAVEEQGAATQDISRNVQEAARGTTGVSTNVASLHQSAEATGAAATQLFAASGDLARQSERLTSRVTGFLEEIRAA
jgi:methyl-accepting chemotaxis protein